MLHDPTFFSKEKLQITIVAFFTSVVYIFFYGTIQLKMTNIHMIVHGIFAEKSRKTETDDDVARP